MTLGSFCSHSFDYFLKQVGQLYMMQYNLPLQTDILICLRCTLNLLLNKTAALLLGLHVATCTNFFFKSPFCFYTLFV